MVIKLNRILHVRLSDELWQALHQRAITQFEGDLSLTVRQLLRQALGLLAVQEILNKEVV